MVSEWSNGISRHRNAYHKVVVFDDGALIDRVPTRVLDGWSDPISAESTYLRRMLSESLKARTTLAWVSTTPVTCMLDMTIPVEQNFVLICASNNIEHHVRLHLEHNNLLVV